VELSDRLRISGFVSDLPGPGPKNQAPVSNRRAGLDVLAVKNGKREQSTKYKIASVSLSPRFANSLASEQPPE
jgi:hypothetical protein